MTNYEMNDDRKLVNAYMHPSGKHGNVLAGSQAWEVYCLGDGFGNLPPEELAAINDGWDWSHVRDSSPEAMARMATWLRDNGFGPDGPRSVPRPATMSIR